MGKTVEQEQNLTREAIAALERGWALTALNGKRPLLDAWTTAPRPTLEQVLSWIQAGRNLGLRTGVVSGIFVVDEDSAKGGSLVACCAELGIDVPATLAVRSGGGLHHYFEAPNPCPGNSGSKLHPHIDTRGEGGQVVFVGSVHPETGRIYEWANSNPILSLPLAFLSRLVAVPTRRAPTFTGELTKYAETALEHEISSVATAPSQQRHPALIRAAYNLGQLAAGGAIPGPLIEHRLYAACEQNGMIAEGRTNEVERTIRDGMRDGSESPRTAPMRLARPDEKPAPTAYAGMPEVLVPGAHKDDAGEYTEIGNDDFANAVLSAIPEGVVYRRGGIPGQLTGDPGSMKFEPITFARVRLIVDAHVRLSKWVISKKDDTPKQVYQTCNQDHAAMIWEAATRHSSIRDLRYLTGHPVFMGRDFELSKPGWNEAHFTYYDEPHSLLGVCEETQRSFSTVKAVLEDLIVDFPFARDGVNGSSASMQNVLGMVLTPMLRPALSGNIPMHMISSPIPRSGKSKLAEELMGNLFLSKNTPAMQLGGSEDEIDKRVLAKLLSGATITHIDNLREFLDSATLASLLTASTYSSRILSKSQMADVPNTLMLIATANNPKATEEIVKRCVPIRLSPSRDDPENRTDFRHPDFQAFVIEQRREVIACCISMVTRWRDGADEAGPRFLGGPPKGGFDRFAEVVGGVLLTAGFPLWRSNERAWIRQADPDTEDLRGLVEEWWSRFQDRRVRPKDLHALAVELGLFPRTMQSATDHGRLLGFTKHVLVKFTDAPVGERIMRRMGAGRNSYYSLEVVAQQDTAETPQSPLSQIISVGY